MPTIVVGDDEDDVLDDILEESDESPLPSPPPAVPQETKERLPPSPPAVVQSPSSPPLPPSPPLSPTEPPLPDPPHDVESVELEVNNEYGTILISPPPRVDSMAQRQGQTFTCVVHGRVREPPVRRAPVPLTQRTPEKRLPLPPPPSPGFASYSDLTALVENAAALERRLVAGELPADVIRRLSMRPPPVNTEVAPAAVVPLIQESEGEHGKTKHTFRNPLAKKRSRKLKEESDPAPHEETTWLTDAAHLTSWRKLASTSRHAKSPAVAPVH
ncbi:hypothetical protein B0H19DRAFT_470021 [Mycena capillaripes]|nr:hypothetical protein B0H19DRAFT_470021 [Mycena capillaripes]